MKKRTLSIDVIKEGDDIYFVRTSFSEVGGDTFGFVAGGGASRKLTKKQYEAFRKWYEKFNKGPWELDSE